MILEFLVGAIGLAVIVLVAYVVGKLVVDSDGAEAVYFGFQTIMMLAVIGPIVWLVGYSILQLVDKVWGR